MCRYNCLFRRIYAIVSNIYVMCLLFLERVCVLYGIMYQTVWNSFVEFVVSVSFEKYVFLIDVKESHLCFVKWQTIKNIQLSFIFIIYIKNHKKNYTFFMTNYYDLYYYYFCFFVLIVNIYRFKEKLYCLN